MIMNCIIVDDEPLARNVLAEYIADVDFLELKGKAENPLKANALLAAHNIDLMFLDINMPKLSGIEYLRTSNTLPLTIITTAYTEYAVEGFEVSALDYIVKPFSFERFLKAVNKAKDYHGLKNQETQISSFEENYFFVKCDGKIEKIQYDDLLYIEAMLNYIVLHTISKKMIVYLTIKGIMEKLPVVRFLKVHKSYIVNLHKIKRISDGQLHIGPAEIPISQHLHEHVMKVILKDKLIKR